jgi:drug/metabolite transporter (DMT)-like permease
MTSESKHASARDDHDRQGGGIVGAIPYLAVLLCAVAGVYIAWRDGSAGGGQGAVIAGVALLIGAVARLALPSRLVGLLGTRRRAIDVLTLAAFGLGLVVAGLVLPH